MRKKKLKWVRLLFPLVLVCLGIVSKDDILPWLNGLQTPDVAQTSTRSIDQEVISGEETQQTVHLNDKQAYDRLASMDFQSGGNAVLDVNNGNSTLDITDWTENKVTYGNLDELNRTTFVTAYLNKQNLGRSEGRDRQVWKPTGWHQKRVDGKEVVNRGHLLAYTSSFNFDTDGYFKEGELGSQDNPKNLATQTAFSNQQVQTHYEKLVRDAQKINENKVIYQIVTVFVGRNSCHVGIGCKA